MNDETPTCMLCGKPIQADAPSSPFCSSRCRLADLGRWLNGSYRISRSLQRWESSEGFAEDVLESEGSELWESES